MRLLTRVYGITLGLPSCLSLNSTDNQVAKYLVENYGGDEMNVKQNF